MKKPVLAFFVMAALNIGSLPNATEALAAEPEVTLTLESRDASLERLVDLLAVIIETRENVKAEIAHQKAKAVADQIYGDDGEQCFDDPELAEYIEMVGGMSNWAE